MHKFASKPDKTSDENSRPPVELVALTRNAPPESDSEFVRQASEPLLNPYCDDDAHADPIKLETALERLRSFEDRNVALRWASIDWLPHRILHFLFTLRWMRGHGDPTADEAAIKRAYFREGFIEGFLFVAGRGLALGILGLVLAQFSEAESVADLISIVRGGEKHALTAVLYTATSSNAFRSCLYAFVALPFAWGLVRGLVEYRSVPPRGEVNALVQTYTARVKLEVQRAKGRGFWKSLWTDVIRWMLPLPPLARVLNNLSRSLRWDARLGIEERCVAYAALIELFEFARGYTKLEAATHVARTLNALRIRSHKRSDASLHQQPQKQVDGLNIQSQDPGVDALSSDEVDEFSMTSDNDLSEVFEALKARAVYDILTYALWPEPGRDRQCEEMACEGSVSTTDSTRPEHQEDGPLERRPLLMNFVYGRYLQWWLGLTDRRGEALAFWVFKIVKLVYSLLFLVVVVRALSDYLHCPQKKGVTFTGVAPYAGRFDMECLSATIDQFNRIPGQPGDTIARVLQDFYLPAFTRHNFQLDLSNKDLSGSAFLKILEGFIASDYWITSLDLSANAIGFADFEDPSDTIEYAKALRKLKHLKHLNLAYNLIGACDYDFYLYECRASNPSGAVELFDAIGSLSNLISLNLDWNPIGEMDSEPDGTLVPIAAGNAFKQLTMLEHLSLNFLSVGLWDFITTAGTVGFFEGLGSLSNLVTLELTLPSAYQCFDDACEGGPAIGHALGKLTKLRRLKFDAPVGLEDFITTAGTIAFASGLAKLENLESLEVGSDRLLTGPDSPFLYGSAEIGAGDNENADGTIAFGQALGKLASLKNLTICAQIGSADFMNPNGTIAVGAGIGQLKSLKRLSLKLNPLGSSTALEWIADGIRNLHLLEVLELPYTQLGTDVMASRATSKFAEGLSSLHSLKVLDLGNNYIGSSGLTSDESIQALNEAFSRLTSLTSIRLDHNPLSPAIWQLFRTTFSNLPSTPQVNTFIATKEDVERYFQGLPSSTRNFRFSQLLILDDSPMSEEMLTSLFEYLKNYRVFRLDLSENRLGLLNEAQLGTLREGFRRIRNSLRHLILSRNSIGEPSDDGYQRTIKIFQAIGEVPKLLSLDLRGNSLGNTKTKMAEGDHGLIKEALSHLTSLEVLDLTGSSIYDSLDITREVSQAIASYSRSLKSLRINGVGFLTNFEVAAAFAAGLQELSNLVTLELGDMYFSEDPTFANAEKVIAEAIGSLASLEHFRLGGRLGSGAGVDSGSFALARSIAKLERLVSLDLSGATIGEQDDNDATITVEIGKALRNLVSLKILDLSSNFIGRHDEKNNTGTLEIAYAIGNMTQLTSLNLMDNYLGTVQESEQAIVDALQAVPNLCYIDISDNRIGYTGKDNTNRLLAALAVKPHLNYDLRGAQNINWDESKDWIGQIMIRELRNACENKICFGRKLQQHVVRVCDASGRPILEI